MDWEHANWERQDVDGLFYPYGGSGFLMSVGMVMVGVGGEPGWIQCVNNFGKFNTDVQVIFARRDARRHGSPAG